MRFHPRKLCKFFSVDRTSFYNTAGCKPFFEATFVALQHGFYRIMAVRNIGGIRAHYPLKSVNRLPLAVSCSTCISVGNQESSYRDKRDILGSFGCLMRFCKLKSNLTVSQQACN